MSKIYNNFTISVFIISGLLLILAFWFICFQSEPSKAINEETSILFPSDSMNLQQGLVLSNRAILINLLQVRETIDANSIESGISVEMQSRMFYCAIMAGLISLLFTRKEKENKLITSIFLFFIITLLYFVDIHQQDLIRRNVSARNVTSKTIDKLVNSRIETFYILSFDNMNAQYKKATEPCGRWLRKAYKVYDPDLSQFVYYIIPWLAILIYIICLRFSVAHRKGFKKNTTK